MRIVLFERSYKYLPSLNIPKKEKIIEVIGTCPISAEARFGTLGPLGIKIYYVRPLATHTVKAERPTPFAKIHTFFFVSQQINTSSSTSFSKIFLFHCL